MIDYSNGYPVQVTTNVTKNTPWLDILSKADYIKPIVETGLDKWKPSNFKGPDASNYKNEEFKNVFVKLRYHGHVPINNEVYHSVLNRYVSKYTSDNDFRKLVDKYISMTEDLWKEPTNKITFKKSNWFVPIPERTEFGKQYYKLENELISEFSKI